ncbi:hypothetical protein LX36DRAFT_664157, partial [Colletotrichum falcatum]
MAWWVDVGWSFFLSFFPSFFLSFFRVFHQRAEAGWATRKKKRKNNASTGL